MSSPWFTSYARTKSALQGLSKRTGAPLPSLVLSFAILHELTAVIPLVGVFYAAKQYGLGDRIVAPILSSNAGINGSSDGHGWVERTARDWVDQGQLWAAKVGTRYGWFGFSKRLPGEKFDPSVIQEGKVNIVGDVANAVVAYGATKALIPVRLALSLYLSPVTSRRVIEPSRHAFTRILKLLFRRA